MILPFIPKFVAKNISSPSSQLSYDGAIFYSAYGSLNDAPMGTHVFKLLNNQVTRVEIGIVPNARGILQVNQDRKLYLTVWNDATLHRILVPEYVPFPVPAVSLSALDREALDRLRVWLGIKP